MVRRYRFVIFVDVSDARGEAIPNLDTVSDEIRSNLESVDYVQSVSVTDSEERIIRTREDVTR